MDLATRIESYLLAHPRWVPVREIESVFGIDERALRAHGRQRPLLAYCAISSAKPGANGLKHIRHATIKERIAAKHACLKRIVAGARAQKDYNRALAHATSGHYPNITDGHGHGLLPL